MVAIACFIDFKVNRLMQFFISETKAINSLLHGELILNRKGAMAQGNKREKATLIEQICYDNHCIRFRVNLYHLLNLRSFSSGGFA